MRDIAGIAGFQALAGQHVAVSDWLTITQQRIDTFAEPRTTTSGFMWTPGAARASRHTAAPWRTAFSHCPCCPPCCRAL